MKKTTKKSLLTVFPYIIAFIISFIGGMIVFAVKDISPFGNNSLLCMDLWGQYFPMYVQQATSESFADLFYSWNGAFGYNNWAQSAYYCNSIFLFILKFSPLKNMVDVLDWGCLLKIGLSAVSCLAMLRYKTRRKSPFLIAGAVSYSLCMYTLAFISQCMWTDSLIYVPLLLIGLERLIHMKKCLMYTLFLALIIISNFYIGFAVCIFSVLYFISNNFRHLHIERNSENKFKISGGKAFGLSIARFSVFSILAGAISAIVIIPVGMAISHTLASDMDAPEKIEWYGNITSYLQLLLPKNKLSLEYSGANIATSILVPFLIPLYFFNKRINIPERIVNGIMLVFLIISMNCNILDYMWHGFHFPNQLPGRWTFLLSLFMIILVCMGVARFNGLTPIRTAVGTSVGFILMMIICHGLGEQEAYNIEAKYIVMLAVTEILIFSASFVLWYGRKKENFRLFKRISICCITAVSLLQIYDSCSNFKNVATFNPGGLVTHEMRGYTKAFVKLNKYGSEWKCGNDDFYRVEMNSGFTFNPSMFGGNRGMSYYSSTMQGDVFKILRYLGNRVYAENVSTVYNISSPVQNGLFGIKYFIDVDKNLESVVPYTDLIHEEEEANIWQNPTALPVAYAVSDDLMDWKVSEEIRSIQNQNEFLNKMCGRDINVFTCMPCNYFDYNNATFSENPDWNMNFYYTVDGSVPVTFDYVYKCEKDAPVYLESNFRAGQIKVTWEGGSKDINTNGHRFAFLGNFSAGTEIKINVSVEGISIGCCGLNLYTFDNDLWNSAYEQLSKQSLNVEKFDTTSITGEITMEQDGLIFTSIPQDGGWKILCDGKKIKTLTFGNAMLGARIPAGTHKLEFKYSVPGLALGSVISILGLIITIWLCCPKIRKKIISLK